MVLKAGNAADHYSARCAGTAQLVGTTFKTLAENVEQGSRILLSDGLIELRVHEVCGGDVVCEIVNGGMLGENKGINLPGIPVRVPSLTEKDSEDLEFALNNGVDAIAVSFVRTAEDVRLVRNRVSAYGSETWIIAKLEKPQAIEHLDAILQVADGIMVARGDLGVEVPPEQVPAYSEAHHPPRRRISEAGDYGDADAGIDDREPAAHARGSFRRGQRGVRRHRCGDAVGRVGGGQVSGGGGGHDGAHRAVKPSATSRNRSS